jgi:hypothetical protein
MIKAFGIGILLFILLAATAYVGFDPNWLIKYSSWLGFGLVFLAIIFSNSIPHGMATGSHMRGHENADDRRERNRLSSYCLVAAIPILLGALLVFSYTHS